MRPCRYGGWYDPRPGAYGPDDPGGTDYNPATGIRDRYAVAAPADDDVEEVVPLSRMVTLLDVLEQWRYAELDLHEVWGIDVEDVELMTSRSWRWLEWRLVDLVTRGPRLAPALRA